MNEVTYKDIEENRIDTSTIIVCKKIRRLAKLDRLVIDEIEHVSELNKHLLEYIEYCNKDIIEYVKEYLSNIQPYMIVQNQSQEKEKSFICAIDNLYLVSVYIKLDTKQFEEVVVSFHEDNIRGIAKRNLVIQSTSMDLVPIFADCVVAQSENNYEVKAFFQKGLKTLALVLRAVKCKDVFIVSRKAIENEFIGYCNDYIRDMYVSNLGLDFESINVFSMLQQISFTSYGRDTFSSLSLLIESFLVEKKLICRDVTDFALITFTQNLKLTKEQKQELEILLEEKFKVTSIKGIDIILNRAMENTGIGYKNPK